MDDSFLENELGDITVKKIIQKKGGHKDEACVTFESREIRDHVNAQASNLANFRGDAGMLLHLPDHLQKTFKALMSLAYDLKKKFTGLKRSVKFDDEEKSLYMYIQLRQDDNWKRIFPEQALKAAAARPSGARIGPATLELEDIESLLGETEGEEQDQTSE